MEMDKEKWVQLCGDTRNTKTQTIVLELVLQKCHTEHQGLQMLFNELIVAAEWAKEKTNV